MKKEEKNQMNKTGKEIDFGKSGGLLPCITQDAGTSEVLMMAYMNSEALTLTMSTGLMHYFSRSRNRIWKKGESSGNVQKVKEIFLDCDGDTLLALVEQTGPGACHTGSRTCFFKKIHPAD